MENLLKDNTLTLEGPLQEEARPVHKDDYASSLRAHGITNYRESEQYYHVGEPKTAQGWLLHITVIPMQIEQLLHTILPVLLAYGAPFKLLKNKAWHEYTNAGSDGNFKIGKVITVFLDEDAIIEPMVRQLMSLTTTGFTGPQVFTDFCLNPILFTRYGSFISRVEIDAWGNRVRVIQDGMGNLFLDHYYTPPVIPQGTPNPFLQLVVPKPAPPKVQLIGGKYLPVKLLKSDAKGNVWKALYFTKYWLPRWCVVKEGKKGMFPDAYGRDTRDKLAWQYQTCKDLPATISLARAIDYFEEPETANVYFVLEYIKGSKDLRSIALKELHNTAWFAQPLSTQLEIVNYLLQAIRAIQAMHWEGYLHRDITGANFLVNRHKKVVLIDLELAWSRQQNLPEPAFGIGTYGYMSPEQADEKRPTLSDDSYSIGALLILILCIGIEPITLVEDDREMLARKLLFRIGHRPVVELIIDCLDPIPSARPDVDTIYTRLNHYRQSLQHKALTNTRIPATAYQPAAIQALLQEGIASLAGDQLAKNGLWYSPTENAFGRDVYPMGNKHVFGGLYRGVGGVLYLLGRLQYSGLDISPTQEKIVFSLQFIQKEMINNIEQLVPSLYYGKAGLAVTLANAIDSGFLPDTPYYRNIIRNCFLDPVASLDLLSGLAGQGLGALQCSQYMEADTLQDLLGQYVTRLLQAQEPNGSWLKSYAGKKPGAKEKPSSFGYGIAGILYFLLEYGNRYPDSNALPAAAKGLTYLAKQAKYTRGHYEWANSDKDSYIGWWWCKGSPGIALVFLKAYELTRQPLYADIAEKALYFHPKYLVHSNLSQCHGLSGLGEVYLEAYRVLHNKEWQERADWIAGLLVHSGKHTKAGSVYWLTERYDLPTADLMIGSGGVLHFLLRYSYPDKLGFPVIGNKL